VSETDCQQAEPSLAAVKPVELSTAGEAEERFFAGLDARMRVAWISRVLVVICAGAFLVQAWLAGEFLRIPGARLIQAGGNFPPAVLDGQVWRLLSSLFLHGGVLHVVLNMLALWQLGELVERLYGRALFLLIYFGSGLLAALASVSWNLRGVSVGASGAIFGVLGALLVWVLVRRTEIPPRIFRQLGVSLLLLGGLSLFGGFAVEGIDNAAHVGGLLGGGLLGLGCAQSLSEDPFKAFRRPLAWGVLSLAVAMGGGLWWGAGQAQKNMRAEIAQFHNLLRQLSPEELHLQQRLHDIRAGLRTRHLSPQDAAQRVEEDVVSGWRGIQAQLAGFALSGAPEAQRQVMLQYVMSRAESAEMLARWLRTGDQQWLLQAESRRQHAERLLMQWQAAQGGAAPAH
jgi:rhomboid protease GluP